MDCRKPVRLTTGLLVPCGKCLGCRIQKRREWSLRCLHETEVHNDTIFVTLTYSDAHIPDYKSLRKIDLQKFLKRIRKKISDKDSERKIRYFACGEYGSNTERPHYHLIIFGMSLREQDKEIIMSCWPFCDWDVPSIRQKSFGLAEADSIRYVCQYIDKKFTGIQGYMEYDLEHREPVFKCSSLGIGRGYCDLHYKQIKNNMRLTLKGVNHSIPRYYIQRLDLDISVIQKRAEMDNNKCFKKITGVNTIDKNSNRLEISEFYKNEMKYKKSVAQSLLQHNKNLLAKLDLKQLKNKDKNI